MLFSSPVFVGEMNEAEMPKTDKCLIAFVIGKFAFDSNPYPLIK